MKFKYLQVDRSNSEGSTSGSAPDVTLTSMTGGETFAPGTNTTIEWTCASSDLVTNPITIEYSTNGGANWSAVASGIANSGSYPWVVPAVADGSTYRFRITVENTYGLTDTSTGADVIVDDAPPLLSAGTFQLAGGAATSLTNTVSLALTITDTVSDIQYVCIKEDTTQPAQDDDCWTPVTSLGATASTNVTLGAGAYHTLEFVPSTYTVYAWAKDAVGNISDLTNGGAGTAGQDQESVTYDPGTPPTVLDVIVANTDTPSSPLTIAERTIATGGDVYIKWKATDDDTIPTGAVSLYYTEDEDTFTQIATGLNNASNGGCTVNGTATGCYLWSGGSPANTYYRIRVGVTDADGIVSFGSGVATNTGNFSILAGNIDDGRAGSAASAFFNFNPSSAFVGDRKSLVVTNDGTIYLKDHFKGILKIDPNTKVATVLVPKTGAMSTDPGPLTSATLEDPAMIALDYQDRILVWDSDRIRRIDPVASTIETIIGGGGSTADTVSATAIDLPTITASDRDGFSFPKMLFDPLPNGDLIFASEEGWIEMTGTTGGARFRHYHASTGTVTSIYPQGTGAEGDSSRDLSDSQLMWAGFSFDPITSEITNFTSIISERVGSIWTNFAGMTFDPVTGVSNGAGTHVPTTAAAYSNDINHVNGRNGKLYQWAARLGRIRQYDPDTNTWNSILSAGIGYCADGTAATSCSSRLDDVFVAANGRIYVLDNDMIRVIDKNHQLLTIYGQSYYTGNGGLAISARFGDADWIERRHNGQLIISDYSSALLREMTIGGSINTIAGNGTYSEPDYGVSATSTSYNYNQFKHGIYVDPTNGWVYDTNDDGLIRLNRTSGEWEKWITNDSGVSCYNDPLSDGASTTKWTGNSGGYSCDVSHLSILGSDGIDLLVSITRYWSGSNRDPYYKSYNFSTKVQSHLMGGADSPVGVPYFGFCPIGSDVSTCTEMPNSTRSQKVTWDGLNNRWLMAGGTGYSIRSIPPGGTIAAYTSVNSTHFIQGFAARLGSCSDDAYADQAACVANSGVWTPAATEKIYYCNSNDGLLYRKDVGGGASTELSFGSDTISCTSETVIWDPTRNSAIFGVSQNGLSGVAEYYDP